MQKVGDILQINDRMEKLIEENFPDVEMQEVIKTAYYKGIEVGKKL